MHFTTRRAIEAGLLVAIQNPQRNADVGGIEQVARQYSDGLYQIVLYELLANALLGAGLGKGTISQQKTGTPSWLSFEAICRIQP